MIQNHEEAIKTTTTILTDPSMDTMCKLANDGARSKMKKTTHQKALQKMEDLRCEE